MENIMVGAGWTVMGNFVHTHIPTIYRDIKNANIITVYEGMVLFHK